MIISMGKILSKSAHKQLQQEKTFHLQNYSNNSFVPRIQKQVMILEKI
jgi:hypothetical protein